MELPNIKVTGILLWKDNEIDPTEQIPPLDWKDGDRYKGYLWIVNVGTAPGTIDIAQCTQDWRTPGTNLPIRPPTGTDCVKQLEIYGGNYSPPPYFQSFHPVCLPQRGIARLTLVGDWQADKDFYIFGRITYYVHYCGGPPTPLGICMNTRFGRKYNFATGRFDAINDATYEGNE